MRALTILVVTLAVACTTTVTRPVTTLQPPDASSAAAARSSGYVLQPHEGERLIFCDSPALAVNIKVSPATTGDAPFAMGTAELSGTNAGTHRNEDEIIYFVSGTGSAFVGDRKVRIEPGVTMYVPRGVRHGFTSEGDDPVRFVWVIAPTGLEERFRAGGHPPSFNCSTGTNP